MEKLVKKLVKHPLFPLLCCIFMVFVIVLFVWQNGKKNKSDTAQQDSLAVQSRLELVDDTVGGGLLPHHFEKPYIGHNVDLSDSLCVLMWQKESASATRDCDGVSDSVFVIGGAIRGRVVGKFFFFKERRFGLENVCKDSTKYLPLSLMTDNPTQTELWREKSDEDLTYCKSLFEAVEICAGTFLFPEETQQIITDMRTHGIFIPEIPSAPEIKYILDEYALKRKSN